MSTSVVENNLFNNSLSAIGEVEQDANNHSMNTFSDSIANPITQENESASNPDNNQSQNDTMNDGANNFEADSQNEDQTTEQNENNTQEKNANINSTQEMSTTENYTPYNKNNPNLEPEQFRKVFIGGLSYKTESDTLKDYFSKFGELVDYVVMKNNETQKPKGFGFITYAEAKQVDEMMKNRPHIIDGRQVEPKRATPREDSGKKEVQATVKKIFIGGLKENIGEEELREYFGAYGNVVEITVMKDKETGKARGFGFVSFDDYDPVDKIILEKHHKICGINLHCQKALPRDQQSNMHQQKGGMGMIRNDQNSFGNNYGHGGNSYGSFGGNFGGNSFGNRNPMDNFNSPEMFGASNYGYQQDDFQNGGSGGLGQLYGSYSSNKTSMGGQMNMRGGRGGGPMRNNMSQGNRGNRTGPYNNGMMMNQGGNRGGFNNRGGGRGGQRNNFPNNNNMINNNPNGANQFQIE